MAVNAVETLRFEPNGGGLIRFDAHLARLARTAAWLGVPIQGEAIRAAALAACDASRARSTRRVRVELRPDGNVTIDVLPLEPPTSGSIIDVLTGLLDRSGRLPSVTIARERVDAADPWLRHKTTRRPLYGPAAAVARRRGWADIVFLNERAEVADGAISTVFVATQTAMGPADEVWTTPPLAAGALPGILRSELLRSGQARVGRVTLAELRGAERVVIGSSLRGLRQVDLLEGFMGVLEQDRERGS